MNSVLIAGCGYVGLRAARLWSSRGLSTFAITRTAEKAAQFATDGLHPLILDLGASLPWPPLPDVDVVLWSVGFDRSPGANRQATWVDGLDRLLRSLPVRTSPRQIIYTSSTGVYGDGDGHDVDELTAPNPNTEGGAACVAAEQVLREFATASMDHVTILRLAGIYGPDRLLRRVSDLRNGVPLASAPDEWLNLIHVEDAVSTIDRVANGLFASGDGSPDSGSVSLMNVVSAKSVTRRTYYSRLARLVSAPEPVFSEQTSGLVSPASSRGRSGNRRVVSRIRESLGIPFRFDDCELGLANAVLQSGNLPEL